MGNSKSRHAHPGSSSSKNPPPQDRLQTPPRTKNRGSQHYIGRISLQSKQAHLRPPPPHSTHPNHPQGLSPHLSNDSGHYSIHGSMNLAPGDRQDLASYHHSNLSSPGRLDRLKKASDSSLQIQYGVKTKTSKGPGELRPMPGSPRRQSQGRISSLAPPSPLPQQQQQQVQSSHRSSKAHHHHQHTPASPTLAHATPSPGNEVRTPNGSLQQHHLLRIQQQQQEFMEQAQQVQRLSSMQSYLNNNNNSHRGGGSSAHHPHTQGHSQAQVYHPNNNNSSIRNDSFKNSISANLAPTGSALLAAGPGPSDGYCVGVVGGHGNGNGTGGPGRKDGDLCQQQQRSLLPPLPSSSQPQQQQPLPSSTLHPYAPPSRSLSADQVFARLAREFPTNPKESEKRQKIFRWLDRIAEEQCFHRPEADPPGWTISVQPDSLDHPESPFYLGRITFELDLMAPVGKSLRKIIDVNCSSGDWAMDMALKYPRTLVYALDPILEVPRLPLYIPENCRFKRRDVSVQEGEFDLVHQRLGAFRIPIQEWTPHFAELKRLTRAGGWIQLAETSGLLVFRSESLRGLYPSSGGSGTPTGGAGGTSMAVKDSRSSLPLPPSPSASSPRSSISSSASYTSPSIQIMNGWVEQATTKCGLNPSQLVEALVPTVLGSGLINVETYDFLVPVGDWAGSRGKLALKTYFSMIQSLKVEILEMNHPSLDEALFEETLLQLKRECHDHQAELVMKVICAQKPPITDDLWR